MLASLLQVGKIRPGFFRGSGDFLPGGDAASARPQPPIGRRHPDQSGGTTYLHVRFLLIGGCRFYREPLIGSWICALAL